ncbi:hypothetical protein BD410DRAFT_809666 [Rickenella mellea]|uniref:Uncharacterized protein n=1 Tax=Rickenella mellea TaxID=50990 RepID=A0A4Y7PGM9_9AGAM|nr:hypothetical protein BD410DRAFT_809666 [Rickenella mellea]
MLPAPRLLKRRATSDVDDPPARCPPAPSLANLQPTTHIDNSPYLFVPPASQADLVTSRLAITTPTDAHPLPLPSFSPAPASQSIYDLLVDPTLADDTLAPLYSPPTSPCSPPTFGLPIAATSDIDQSSAPSSPLASPCKSAAAITIHMDTLQRFSGENFCSRSKQECLMTQSPRLDLIGPCKLYKNNIVILVSTGATSPTRWTDVEPLTTYALYGNNFVQAFRTALPQIYSPLVRLKVIDDIPVAVRSRLTRAKPPPIYPHRPVTGLAQPLSTLAHMAAMLLQERNGINLVTSFSWREPRAVHTIDIIPRDLLTEHLRKAQNIANGADPESDPVSEYTEPDTVPDLIEPGELPE